MVRFPRTNSWEDGCVFVGFGILNVSWAIKNSCLFFLIYRGIILPFVFPRDSEIAALWESRFEPTSISKRCRMIPLRVHSCSFQTAEVWRLGCSIIHTYIHTLRYVTLRYVTLHYITYIHTYILTYLHTYIHTYVTLYQKVVSPLGRKPTSILTIVTDFHGLPDLVILDIAPGFHLQFPIAPALRNVVIHEKCRVSSIIHPYIGTWWTWCSP